MVALLVSWLCLRSHMTDFHLYWQIWVSTITTILTNIPPYRNPVIQCKLTLSHIVDSYPCASISTVSRERIWGMEVNPHALLISALEAGVVSFTLRQLCCQEKSFWCPLYRMQRLPQGQTGPFVKKRALLLSITEPIILRLLAHNLVPVLPQLACRKECESKKSSSKLLNS